MQRSFKGEDAGPSVAYLRTPHPRRVLQLLPLLALLLLLSGCLVVPVPLNRFDPQVRTNITPDVAKLLSATDLSREKVLLQLGEPDAVSADEHEFRFRTERIKWDIFWAVGGGYSAATGDIEVKRFYELVVRFDEHGKLVETLWLAGSNTNHLQQEARWGPAETHTSE